MNDNKKKGIAFIAGGIILPMIVKILFPYISSVASLAFIIGWILIVTGIILLIRKKPEIVLDNDSSVLNNESSVLVTGQLNKVVDVTLTGGIIGLIGVRPYITLNKQIKKENANGWRVIQIIPSSSGNLLLAILRLLLLMVTFFLYTTTEGYYIVMERMETDKK